jgi:phosphate:Na+ symporter
VGGGVVPLGSGAALVIGANVGTTSTAGLAVIGATANAKRVAAGHVAFNLITGVVALLLLPFLLLAIDWGRDVLHLGTEPVAVLAAFHTLFNLLGVALILPLTNRLIALLEGWFRTAEEDDATPRYLDRNVLATPRLALDAMVLELTRVGQIARRLARAALSGDPRFQRGIRPGRQSLSALIVSIGDYIQRLQRTSLPADLDALLPTTIRVSRHYSEAAELASMVAAGRLAPAPPGCGQLEESLMHFVADADALVERVGIDIEGYEAAVETVQVAELKERYKHLKASLLDAGARGVWPVHHLVATLDWLSNVRRLVEQIERGARYLASLDPLLEDVADEEKEDAEALGDEAP